MKKKKSGIYEKYIKRILDAVLSFFGLLVLSPLLLVLTIAGAAIMKGNPFFTQLRPGKDEKIFRLVKFRSMTCETDSAGNLLPDAQRLTRYGQFLRASSLDELLELWNILKGDMSIVGPRPLLVEYLPRYNAEQARRHEVRPGLTGYAQVNGRNAITWEEKFRLDVEYVDHISFLQDVKIVYDTAKAVLKREGISAENSATMEEFMGNSDKFFSER